MIISTNRVNLSEKDIEDWLFNNPKEIPHATEYYDETPIDHWIGRQYRLPSGIADLIGIRENGKVAVIEVKNVPINKAAVLQVCRYASDVESILDRWHNYKYKRENRTSCISRIIVGPSIDDQTLAEANVCDVTIVQFDAHLRLEMSELEFNDKTYENRETLLDEISKQSEWKIFGIHHSDFHLIFSDDDAITYMLKDIEL